MKSLNQKTKMMEKVFRKRKEVVPIPVWHGQKPKKVGFLDIETSPNLSYIWGKYEQNALGQPKKPWRILSFSYSWLGESKVHVYALPDFPGYKKNKDDDRALVEKLWEFFDEADFIIAHNGDQFDIRKSNARFLAHKMKPPAPYQSIDTLKIARRHFGFDSNKLDDLANALGVGRKVPHTGFSLWEGCMDGNMKSWRLMKQYNAHDVELLESVYLKLRAWAKTHPNLNPHSHQGRSCPLCGSTRFQSRGFSFTATGLRKQRYKCLSCGRWSLGKAEKRGNETIV